jgi:two-component sensor histidine kinase
VMIDVERQDSRLKVVVADDGVGMRDGIKQLGSSSRSGLGSQIVQTLVTNELRGTIDWGPREGGGTQVVIEIELRDDPHR